MRHMKYQQHPVDPLQMVSIATINGQNHRPKKTKTVGGHDLREKVCEQSREKIDYAKMNRG